MSWIVVNIGPVLTICGALTCSMLAMAVAPRFMTHFIFGENLDGPAALLLARGFGALVFASGLLLIYAATHLDARLPILLFSGAGKLSFVGLVLAERRLRNQLATAMAVGDFAIVVLFVWYLWAR